MAVVTCKPFLPIGAHYTYHNTLVDANFDAIASSNTMSASGHKTATLLRVPKTGTIDSIEFVVATITQWPTNGIRFSLQDVSAGNPGDADGTQDQYRVVTATPTAYDWTNTGIVSSDGTDGGTKRSVTVGDQLAIVAEFETFATGDSIAFGAATAVSKSTTTGFDGYTTKGRYHNGTSWGDITSQRTAGLGIKYTDGTIFWHDTAIWANGGGGDNLTSATTPDEFGLKWTSNIPYQISGLVFASSNVVDTGLTLHMYDSGSTLLATATLTGEFLNSATDSNGYYYVPFDNGDTVTMTAGAAYYFSAKAYGTSRQYDYVAYQDQAHMNLDLVPEGEGTVAGVTRTDAGAWTESAVKRYHILPVANGIDVPAGGGQNVFLNMRKR